MKTAVSETYAIEDSAIGRIVVAQQVPAGFAVFYTTRDFDGRLNGETVPALLGVVRDRFGIEAKLTTCTQVHGAAVRRATQTGLSVPHRWSECDECDALIGVEKQSALGIKVADCLPVTMIDPRHSVIANVHSGWRGAVQRITLETLDMLERETAFDARDAQAWLGPSIRVCCFEVGEEVAGQFDARYVDRTLGAKPHVDLIAFTTDLLRERGLAVHDSGLCTRCGDELFHSYRRHGKSGGRNLAIVAQ